LTSEKSGIIEKVPNSTLGEQPGLFREKYPQNNFSTNEPISTNNMPIDSARQPETHKNFENFSKVV
jgi:hypothetical protein